MSQHLKIVFLRHYQRLSPSDLAHMFHIVNLMHQNFIFVTKKGLEEKPCEGFERKGEGKICWSGLKF